MYQESKQQGQKRMSATVIDYEAREVATAKRRIEKWVEKETTGFGDDTNALKRICSETGLPFWTLYRVLRGKAKTISSGLRAKIADDYIAYCESQLEILVHELEIEKAINPHADYANLDGEVSRLAEKIESLKDARVEK